MDIKPLLQASRGELHEDWAAYVRVALYICHFFRLHCRITFHMARVHGC